MRVSFRSLLVGCVALGLASGMASVAWGELDTAMVKRAEAGDAEEQRNLGAMYELGFGVAPNDVEAARWYRKAAEQGNAAAQRDLGVMYAYGKGVERDDEAAATWYRKAAEQGDTQAQYNLAGMYAYGNGVAEDLVLAYMWLNLAREQGNATPRDTVESFVRKMTRDEIKEAEELAREWHAAKRRK